MFDVQVNAYARDFQYDEAKRKARKADKNRRTTRQAGGKRGWTEKE